jgi:hyperosmotically inducible periplasmic protein
MNFLKLLPAVALASALAFTGCKPKDSDIKTSVEKKLDANPSTAAVDVMVNDGVATLSGQVADEAAKASAESDAKSVKGVKSVINNTNVTVAAAPTQPVTVATDDNLVNSVRDATKDYPTVTATVSNGVITLNGEIQKNRLPNLMQALNALQPKSIDNKLTVK